MVSHCYGRPACLRLTRTDHREPARIDQMMRLGRVWAVDREDVDLAQHGIERQAGPVAASGRGHRRQARWIRQEGDQHGAHPLRRRWTRRSWVLSFRSVGGVRGGAAIDREKLISLLLDVSRIAMSHPEISEIDLPCVLSIQTGTNEPRKLTMPSTAFGMSGAQAIAGVRSTSRTLKTLMP